MFDADIKFFAERHDPCTRQWFFDDFNTWFHNPGNTRAYVLLGDPGVGKSVIAGALAQRVRETGQLGAAYFCRHNDGTRNDPRYLLGTVAHQLSACNDEYKEIVGGEDGVKMLLGNSKLRVKELFTKLLHEPLSMCRPFHKKFLVIIDALDETESGEDFLDLIKHQSPMLPEWLVFFVTSRPGDSVQSRLMRYKPCIKICSGNSDQQNFYQQHEQDIQNFLKERINFPCVNISVDDVFEKCDGLFLYAHYIVEELKEALASGKKISNLNNLFPGDIEEFFLHNFRRVYDHVGENIFKKLFGCVVVAPSPLPVSVISFILNRENSNHDEQQVIDAVSQFLVLRNPDQTLTFLHNLVPAWLTNDTKAPRKLLICKKMGGKYLSEVFVEILSSIVQESSSPCTSIDVKLKDYVMRVAVCFLSQFGGKDWLELVFTCLTNYHFIERRLLSGKIEIYHLLQDLKLVKGCLDVGDKKKQDLLREIAQVLLSNTFILFECPQLLHSCLRTASSAVQETLLLTKFPVPWFECTVLATVDPAIADMNCFATSCDNETVVGAKGRSLMFFDARRAQRADGPFEISEQIIHNISHLEYSRDSKFIFFGRLDKWFSVERKCVEDFLQFDWNATVYQWGFHTRDGESIVVKRNMEDFSCSWSENTCLGNLLALWAVKEIKESRDDVPSLYEELVVDGPIKCLLKYIPFKTNQTRPHEKIRDLRSILIGPCRFCCKLCSLTVEGYKKMSLRAVREKIIEIYPWIFQWQILDLKTGRPVLERVFARNIQLDPFTYICHVSYFVNRGAMEIAFSDFSVCNIAIVTAIRYLEGIMNLKLEWEPPVELKPAKMSDLKPEPTVKLEELLEDLLMRDIALRLTEELKRRVNLNLETRQIIMKLEQGLEQGLDRKEGVWESYLRVLKKEKMEMHPYLVKEFQHRSINFEDYKYFPEGLHDEESIANEDIHIYLSPGGKWVLEVDGFRNKNVLRKRNRELSCDHETPQRDIGKFTRFSFTKDDLYLVYLTDNGSLRALSLETGTVLTTVTSNHIIYFTKQHECGFLFYSDTEEKAILFSDLSNPFKFISASPVKLPEVEKAITAVFCSTNTVLSVGSDLKVSFWQTAEAKDSSSFISQSLHDTSDIQVKDCALSPNGQLIAIHQGSKLVLYTFTDFSLVETRTVFTEEFGDTISSLTFSGDGTSLLFCIQAWQSFTRGDVWDVVGKFVSSSVKSQALVAVECCCISSGKQEIMLCGKYQIEIWKYGERSYHLSTTIRVEEMYHSVTFSQCIVSSDDQLLVCCIANTILVYRRSASDIISSKRVLLGHLGKIEFCRFLKENRYLISYSIDSMVFLWDTIEFKAVGFARIPLDTIACMAVSPDEEKVVCYSSTNLICVVKLCELKSPSH